MKHHRPGILNSAMFFGAALTIVSSVSLAAPNTGSAPLKTDTQCKAERDVCLKACDKLIHPGAAIKRCKDRRTDDYIMCTPLRVDNRGDRSPLCAMPGAKCPAATIDSASGWRQ